MRLFVIAFYCIDKCYSDSAPSIQMAEKWFADFKLGRTTTDNAERSGRPKEEVTPENIKKVYKVIFNRPKAKFQDICS